MSSFTARVAKDIRGRRDAARAGYQVARAIRHPLAWAARRRVASTVRPAPALVVPPDTGFRLFPPGQFPETGDVVREARGLLSLVGAATEARRQQKRSKQFLINLLDPATLDCSHPLVRLALRADLLDAIVAYMGTVPVLRSIQVLYSAAVDREPISSQLYHCDADDRRQLKIFVLCSDVAAANGPLTLLDAAHSATVRRRAGYSYDERLTDEQVTHIIGPAARPVQVIGPAGTVCVADTSRCFHFGSRVEAGAPPRLVALVQFLSPFAFVLPGDWRQGAVLARLAGSPGLSPLQRAVLTGEAR